MTIGGVSEDTSLGFLAQRDAWDRVNIGERSLLVFGSQPWHMCAGWLGRRLWRSREEGRCVFESQDNLCLTILSPDPWGGWPPNVARELTCTELKASTEEGKVKGKL